MGYTEAGTADAGLAATIPLVRMAIAFHVTVARTATIIVLVINRLARLIFVVA